MCVFLSTLNKRIAGQLLQIGALIRKFGKHIFH